MPTLLSDHLQVSVESLSTRGVFDAVIGIDTRLFVDPTLLVKTKITEFKKSRSKMLRYFADVITLIKFGDNARIKKIAISKLTFPEPEGISIGYGNDTDDGAGVGPEKAERIFDSASEIYKLGIIDPEIIEIVGIFEEGFGPDLISDMTINIIKDDICRYTERIGKELGVKLDYKFKDFFLPKHPTKDEYLLFVPRELLRDLPIAANWEEVFVVAQHNAALREKVNSLLKNAFGKTKKPTKKDFRNILWGNKDDLSSILGIYKKYDANPYDFVGDPQGWGNWYQIGTDIYRDGRYSILKKPETQEELIASAKELVERFKRSVEENGTNKILYGVRDGSLKPFHEEVSQLIFFAIADNYCKDRNIFLARESDAGSGPVDFSFGVSYDAKVLFELKKSLHSDIVGGYTNQLKVYQKSQDAFHAFYIILRMTDKSSKIDKVLEIESERNKKREKTPTVVIVDARLKESASKRK